MQVLRWVFVGCLIAALAGASQTSVNCAVAAPAAEASNKEKILGVWEMTKGDEKVPKGATFEFTKEGKVKMTATIEGRKISFELTYSVDGNKLKTVSPGKDGKKVEDIDTIEKLTDTEMVLKDSKGKVVEFKKKKK